MDFYDGDPNEKRKSFDWDCETNDLPLNLLGRAHFGTEPMS